MLRVFVVSPLPAVRAGLRALLGLADDLAVVGEAERLDPDDETGLEAPPDVIVLETGTDIDPAELLERNRVERGPGLVILGPLRAPRRLPAELGERGWGYLPREASGEQLVATVRAVASGLVVVDPALGGDLFAPAALAVNGSVDGPGEDLTAREREVLQLVAEGLANKTIASRLGISEHTVKFHVAAILAKLGAGSRTEAVHLGARRGVVTL
jgi:DNA-binding NarL/FixJ family response regulator